MKVKRDAGVLIEARVRLGGDVEFPGGLITRELATMLQARNESIAHHLAAGLLLTDPAHRHRLRYTEGDVQMRLTEPHEAAARNRVVLSCSWPDFAVWCSLTP